MAMSQDDFEKTILEAEDKKAADNEAAVIKIFAGTTVHAFINAAAAMRCACDALGQAAVDPAVDVDAVYETIAAAEVAFSEAMKAFGSLQATVNHIAAVHEAVKTSRRAVCEAYQEAEKIKPQQG